MNIQQYINNLTDQEFEELCTEYLKLHYKNKNITIHGTRLKKDGGKDIVGTASDVPYEIWAECKRHNRALGLEKISKNVILVISKGINELIYFSTSDITRNAIKHVSIVAAKHNFSVTFIYGKRLYQELSVLPCFQYGFEKSNEIVKNDLKISRFFSVFEDTEKYTENSELVLQRDNIFYIDIYLTNLYSTTISDVTCILPKMTDIIFHIPEIHNGFNMLQGSNRVIQIRAEILSSYTVKHIPSFTLKYKFNNHTYSKKVPGGYIDPTKLIYYPLVGENVQNFLSNKILPLLKDNASAPIYMLNITGKSGTGKTRLLSEIINTAKSFNFQTLYCDAKKQNGFDILREYLCACLGLPYGTGNISCTLDDFSKIVEQNYGNHKVSDAVFSFVFLKKLAPDILYYLKEALLFFSCNIVGGTPLVWTIDNVQCLDKETLDVIYFLIEHLQECFPKVIFSLGTNTEIVPLESQGFVYEFLIKINEYEDAVSYVYTCDEMQNNDAKTLYYHAIPNLQGFDYFIHMLLNKSGKRPFDIIMLIHWFYDQNLVNVSTHNMVIPSAKKEIENFINKIPVKSKEIIEQRFKLQKHKSFSFDTALSYFDAFKTVVKSILYFGGETPIDFLSSLNIDDDMLFELSQSLFFKYMDKYPKIVFYHDNIYRYFEEYEAYQNDRSLSLKIIKWLNENDWYKSNLRTTAIFDCYIRASEYEEAVKFGMSSVSSEYNKRNFQAIIHIGTKLLKDSPKASDISEESTDNPCAEFMDVSAKFLIYYDVADAYRIYQDLSQSVYYYKKAYKILQQYSISGFTSNDTCQFFHRYSNACISAADYEEALTVLNYFKEYKERNPFYDFIMHNRYSIVYLAINDIENALLSINKSLEIAQKYDEPQWESVSYSDKAYIYYRAREDKENTILYFNQAVEKHVPDKATINRSSEILAQKAFVNLLTDKLEEAEHLADLALNRALKINGTSMEVKSRNLLGIIQYFSNKTEMAFSIWRKDLIISAQRMNKDGIVKLHTNLGAAYILQSKYMSAKEELEQAYALYLKFKVSSMTHKPLIYNLLLIYNILGDTSKRDKLFEKESYFDNLSSYYNQLISCNENIITDRYWPLQFEHVFFNY